MADGGSHHLWRFLFDPARVMTAEDARRLAPAMERLAMHASPATAHWLLAPALPAGFAGISADAVAQDRLYTRYLRAQARRWLAQLAAAGIPLLTLKGFATGLAVYPDPDIRGIGDVDLLVRAADLPRLVGCLRGEGFVFRKGRGTPVWGLASDASFHPFVAPGGRLSFDLHIHPDDHPVHRSLTTEAAFAAAREAMDDGLTVRLPCDAHLLLLAMSNAARDKYDPNALRSFVDVAVMLTRSARPPDWDAVAALAAAGGYGDLARLAVQLAIALGWRGDGLPPALRRPFRGLAAWELGRIIADLAALFAAPPSKLALQRREWLLTGGPRVAAWRSARRLRGLLRPWPGMPQA